MKKQLNILIFSLSIFAACLALACANRGQGPQGGPKDETPPRLVKSNPKNGQVNFTKNEMELHFDEIVQVQGAAEKVVVSPPQQKPPTVKSVGRTVIVKLADTLESDASYTIDFSNAIVDNNEKNELENFALSFSTGSTIDSLELSGTVLEAATLNPMPDLVVGIHSDFSDTAFTNKVFRRITKTDSKGKFTIKNIKPDKYKLFAIKDIGNNYRFDFPNEMIAFTDSIYEPSVIDVSHYDTIWNGTGDTATIDTIAFHNAFEYLPKGIMMRAFVEDKKKQFLSKSERKEQYMFSLQFAKPLDSLPHLSLLNYDNQHAVMPVLCESKDTLNYWIVDSALVFQDTILATVEYPKTDSLNVDVSQLDTITFLYRKPRTSRQAKQAANKRHANDSTKVIEFLPFQSNVKSSHDYFTAPKIIFAVPTKPNDLSMCRVELKVDTTWQSIEGAFEQIDGVGLQYQFNGVLQDGKDYRLALDSAAFLSVMGLHNNKMEMLFATKKLDSYGEIIVTLKNYNSKERLQLLDSRDVVLREVPLDNGKAKFDFLMPNDYYLRLYVDEDDNKKWTNGDYTLKRQPEDIYYFLYPITVRALWEIEEEWDYKEVPLDEQKPIDLIKTK